MGNGNHGLRQVRCSGGDLTNLLSSKSDFAGHGGDAGRGAFRDTLDSLGDLAVGAFDCLLLLHVQIFGVFADDDEIDGGTGCAAAGGGLDGANIGVEVETLAESDDGGGVASDFGAWGAVNSQLSSPLIY